MNTNKTKSMWLKSGESKHLVRESLTQMKVEPSFRWKWLVLSAWHGWISHFFPSDEGGIIAEHHFVTCFSFNHQRENLFCQNCIQNSSSSAAKRKWQSELSYSKKKGRTPFYFSFFISSFHCGFTCWLSTESHSKLLCLSPSFWSSSGSWFRFKYLCKYWMVHRSIWNYQHSSTTKTLCWLHFILWIHKTR